MADTSQTATKWCHKKAWKKWQLKNPIILQNRKGILSNRSSLTTETITIAGGWTSAPIVKHETTSSKIVEKFIIISPFSDPGLKKYDKQIVETIDARNSPGLY